MEIVRDWIYKFDSERATLDAQAVGSGKKKNVCEYKLIFKPDKNIHEQQERDAVRKIYATCLSEVFKRAWFELFKSRLLRALAALSGVNKTQSDHGLGARLELVQCHQIWIKKVDAIYFYCQYGGVEKWLPKNW